MHLNGHTLVVLAHQQSRHLVSHIDFEKVTYVTPGGHEYRGYSARNILFVGFSDENPPSQQLLSSLQHCVATHKTYAVFRTNCGRRLFGEVFIR